MTCSIFIASSHSSGWPGSTCRRRRRASRTTVPGIGASSEPAATCARRVGEPRHGVQRDRAEAESTQTRPASRATSNRVRTPPASARPRPASRLPAPRRRSPSTSGPPRSTGSRPRAGSRRRTRPAVVRLALQLRRHVAPAARQAAEHPGGRAGARAQRRRAPRPAPTAVPRPAPISASGQAVWSRPGRACRGSRCRSGPAANAGCRSTRTSRSRLVTRPWIRARASACAQRRGRLGPGRRPRRSPWPASGRSARRPDSPPTTPESSRSPAAVPRPARQAVNAADSTCTWQRRAGAAVPLCGCQPRGRVLGVQPASIAWPGTARRLGAAARRPPRPGAAGHQVQAGRALGHRMLHLEPGVHLQEVEPPVGVGQELHGARACVADRRGPRGPPRRAAGRASRRSLARAGAGVSSMIFWCRRCIEHSRSPSVHTVPCGVGQHLHLDVPAAPRRTARQKTSPSPNAAAASARAAATRPPAAASSRTTRMPRPPPPAAALTSTGRSAAVTAAGSSAASTGTPAAAISSLGLDLGAHRRDRVGRRADPGQARVDDRARRTPRSPTGSRSPGAPRRRPPRSAAADEQVGPQIGVRGRARRAAAPPRPPPRTCGAPASGSE